jgi:hypothetical protein
MFKMLFLLCLVLGLFSGCAVATKTIPIREIDRPINMPAGIKSVSMSYWSDEMDKNGFLGGLFQTLQPSRIGYALTDKITFSNLPFPVIQYQVYGSNSYHGDTVIAPSIALAVVGGIQSDWIFQGDYYLVKPQLGIVGKKILCKNIWLSFNAGTETRNSDVILGYAQANFGYQLWKRNSIGAGLNLSMYKTISNNIDTTIWNPGNGNSRVYLTAPLGWKLNLTNWCSFGLFYNPEIEYTNKKILGFKPVTSCSFDFNW